VALVGRHEETFTASLNARLAKAAAQSLRTSYDLIFLRVDQPRDLARIQRASRIFDPTARCGFFILRAAVHLQATRKWVDRHRRRARGQQDQRVQRFSHGNPLRYPARTALGPLDSKRGNSLAGSC